MFCFPLPACSCRDLVIYAYFSPQNEVMLSIFVCIFFLFIYHEFIFRSQWANLPHSFQWCTVSLSGKLPSFVDSGLSQHYLCPFQLSVTNYPAIGVLIKIGINLREFTFFYSFLWLSFSRAKLLFLKNDRENNYTHKI